MASSGNVEAVLEVLGEVEQPAKACDGESGFPAITTVESQPTPEEQHDMTPEAADDHHEASEVSTTSAEEPEQQKPPVANSKEEVEPKVSVDDDDQGSTRERLKRHRREMAGRVWVPEIWGQEKLLNDWMDCAVFDRPLVPAGLLKARRALIAECCSRRPDRAAAAASSTGSSQLGVRNGCS